MKFYKKALLAFSLLALIFSTGCVPDKFQFVEEIGSSGTGRGQFLSATDLDLTKEGNLVVCDNGNTRYQIITPEGTVKITAGEQGREGYKIHGMGGLGVNHLTNDVWVCDQRGNKLVRFDPTGDPNLKVTAEMKYPLDVAIDRAGNAYVIMSKLPYIYKYDSYGNFVNKIGGTGKAALLFPTSILIHDKNIFIADFGGKRIVQLNLSGEFVKEYKRKGEYEAMKGPSGLHIDKEGNLYILDLGEVPVVLLSHDGELISKIGDFGNEKGRFIYPTGVVAKSNDEIFVLDNSRNTILRFKKKPEK
ncbi:MAG: NHL repeat-containing protein [Candidatus Rifleibacteriota bacterium]